MGACRYLHEWMRVMAEPPSSDTCRRCGIKRSYAWKYKPKCDTASDARIQQDMDEIWSQLNVQGRNPEAMAIREQLGW